MLNLKRTLSHSTAFHALIIIILVSPLKTWGEDKAKDKTTKSKTEIEELINTVGKTPPEWFESVKLDYPRSLDLNWPQRPPTREWNNQRNVGQYVWDIINPNPGKWKSGIRFMHFMLKKHADNVEVRNRVMQTLGRMYFDFFRDYPRAAFWWRAAGVDKNESPQGVYLAECYWRMGNMDMAKELLGKLPNYYSAIKLWADMGDTDKALRVAGAFAESGYTDMAYLSAGDACRTAGKLNDAIDYYSYVLTLPASGRMAKRILRNQQRAQANIEGIKLYDSLDLKKVPDGTYSGNAPGFADELYVEVNVAKGRIESVRVTSHKEKQFYSAIEDTPAQIVKQQGLTGIDATSGATITSEAIINATAKALAKAAK
ncbi:MAG: FMN-binding protein [Pirellulales bacterium]|nr:FMN-binding protein [Pirellulales bacterium]